MDAVHFFIWPGYMEKRLCMCWCSFWVCVEYEAFACRVSLACSDANCSEMMATKSWHLPIKMKIWFSHSEPKRSVHLAFLFSFLISLEWPLPFCFVEERKRSHLIFSIISTFLLDSVHTAYTDSLSEPRSAGQLFWLLFELTFGEKEIGGLPQENPLLLNSLSHRTDL